MKEKIRQLFKPLLLPFVRLHVHPNVFTTIHLILGFFAAYLIYRGFFISGGIVYLVSCIFDFFDGAIARFSGLQTKSGAIYDSVADRIQEGVVLFAIAISTKDLYLPFLAMLTGFLVSYTKARSEAEGIKLNIGLFTRPMRSVVLGITIIFKLFPLGLYFLIGGNIITFVHRFLYAFISGTKKR